MKDYSQSGEQALVAEWADGRPPGRVLDIGAGDGETFSNSRTLIEQGWSAVLVEPAPWAVDRLSGLYWENKRVEVVNAVVTPDRWGLMPFQYARDDHLSTMNEKQRKRWAKLVPFEPVTVVAVQLRYLIGYFAGGFDMVTIDAEGESMALLAAYRELPAWEQVECLVVEVEDEKERDTARGLVITEGWQGCYVTANNVVLIR